MAKPVVHFEICGKDHKKMKEFYGNLFEWEYNDFGDGSVPYALVSAAGEKSIGGGLMGSDGNIPTYITFYVQVDDLQKYLDKAEKMGGKTVHPPTPIQGIGSSAMFTDPDGNMVGLFKEGE